MKFQPREWLVNTGIQIFAALLLANSPLHGQTVAPRGVSTSPEEVAKRQQRQKAVRKPEAGPTSPAKAVSTAATRPAAKVAPSPESRAAGKATSRTASPSRAVPTTPPANAPKDLAAKTAAATPGEATAARAASSYPWKRGIVTTVFWAGERPSGVNTVSNEASSWDADWARNYGGYDTPDPGRRRNFVPVAFAPRQNPFYVALPYNDITSGGTKAEARRVIPWFSEVFEKEGQSVCHNRWLAIRNRAGRVAYAQWSDCGPFRTDHWEYVFGTERPKPNLNHGAGLDVSPATRDFLGLDGTDVTDWRFVESWEVPSGPWTLHAVNHTATRGKGGAGTGRGTSLPEVASGPPPSKRLTASEFAFSRMLER